MWVWEYVGKERVQRGMGTEKESFIGVGGGIGIGIDQTGNRPRYRPRYGGRGKWERNGGKETGCMLVLYSKAAAGLFPCFENMVGGYDGYAAAFGMFRKGNGDREKEGFREKS